MITDPVSNDFVADALIDNLRPGIVTTMTKPMKVEKASVQSLMLTMCFNNTVLATGTGFVVDSPNGPHLITNRHNVTGRHPNTNEPASPTGGIPNRLIINHNHQNGLCGWITVEEPLYDDEIPRWIEHPVLGSKADFVALPLTNLESVALYPHDLKPEELRLKVGVTEPVSVVGFPFGMTAGMSSGGCVAIWANGFLASDPEMEYNCLPIQLIDCRARPGQSGSPVIALRTGSVMLEDGRLMAINGAVTNLIGIYSGRINPESDIGIVWKTSALIELIESIEMKDSRFRIESSTEVPRSYGPEAFLIINSKPAATRRRLA